MSIQKDGTIRITSADLSKGISDSKYIGISKVVNLDIFSEPGVIKIANSLVKDSGVIVDERPNYSTIDEATGDLYVLGSGGGLFRRAWSTGTWTNPESFGSTDDGMIYYKDYLLVMRANASSLTLDSYGPLSGSEAKSTSDITFSSNSAGSTYQIPMHVAIGDSLYIGAGRYLHALSETAGQNFNPTDSNTYTKEEEVLVLPEGYEITYIDQVGPLIVVGTTYGSSEVSGEIIIWDPNKSGTDSADADIRIPTGEESINNLAVIGNAIYSHAGRRGAIFVSNTTQSEILKRIGDTSRYPNNLTDTAFIKDAIETFDGGILVGLGKDDSDEPQVYYIRKGIMTSFTISEGEVTDDLRISTIQNLGRDSSGSAVSQYIVGWENQDDTTYGVDIVSTTKRYTGYSAYFESQFYSLGSNLRSKTFNQVGFRLAKPLEENQGVKIKYRTTTDGNWTTLFTTEYNANTDITGYEKKAGLPSKLENIQFRVELTTGSGDNPGTPELLEFYAI